MSLISSLADAVVTELSSVPAGAFALPFTAQRHYRPLFDLTELKDLRVSAVPRSIAIVSLGRNVNQHDVAVDIAVQKKVGPADGTPASTAELDQLMNLVEQIGDFFRLRRLSAFPAALWTRTENQPIYAPEHLEQHRVFTSVLSLTFRVVR